MEPNHKLEKEFRKKLNAREIAPSPNSWDRLDAMLTVAENQKPVRRLNWLYIAAGFLGFVLLSTIFVLQSNNLNEPSVNSVVIQTEKGNPEETQPIQPIEKLIMPAQENQVAAQESDKPIKSTTSTKAVPVLQQQLQSNVQIAENHLAPIPQKNNTEIPKAISRKELNVDELLASVETTPETTKQSVKIDAGALLSQVDGELDLSFREKVIRSVGKNYKDVKVALANRNTINN